MAPLKVASFDIEYIEPRRLPLPIKEYGKTALEIVIWVSDQFKSVSRTNTRRSGIKFISIFLDDVPSSDISKVFAKDKVVYFGEIPVYRC
jgi:hypothetical protein